MAKVELLVGRLLLALIFISAGWSKIGAYEGTQGYMNMMGVPGELLPLVIILELGGGLLIALGVFTRYLSWALAGFSVIAAVIFHLDFSDQMQSILFMKNLAIAGGFLVLARAGAGSLSLGHKWFK